MTKPTDVVVTKITGYRPGPRGERLAEHTFAGWAPHPAAPHVAAIREVLKTSTAETRLAFFKEIAEGYCTACGEVRTGVCHCENDE